MIYRRFYLLIGFIVIMGIQSCGLYSLNSASVPENIKTFQVDYFVNEATRIEPGIERTFTLALQDIILNQSSLNLVNTNGDYIYQGEITRFYIAPITATAQNTAAQNRLTIAINVRFTNTKDDEKSFERSFSFFNDYPAASSLNGPVLDNALEVIYTQITQEIYNATLTDW